MITDDKRPQPKYRKKSNTILQVRTAFYMHHQTAYLQTEHLTTALSLESSSLTSLTLSPFDVIFIFFAGTPSVLFKDSLFPFELPVRSRSSFGTFDFSFLIRSSLSGLIFSFLLIVANMFWVGGGPEPPVDESAGFCFRSSNRNTKRIVLFRLIMSRFLVPNLPECQTLIRFR